MPRSRRGATVSCQGSPHSNFSPLLPPLRHPPQLDNQVVVSDYTQMDRVLKEERNYILNLCKKIKKSGCNVLLIQKSILRCAKGVAAKAPT